MMVWVVATLVSLMLIGAFLVVAIPDLLGAVAASTAVSLALSVLFVVLRAPDVAMAEAAVGAGLAGVLFALALRKTESRRTRDEEAS